MSKQLTCKNLELSIEYLPTMLLTFMNVSESVGMNLVKLINKLKSAYISAIPL